MRPEVMLRQVAGLADDLRRLAGPLRRQVGELLDRAASGGDERGAWSGLDQVYLTGDGDSYHASCAAEMAFESLGEVTCRPMSAQRFVDYGASWMRPGAGRRTLVVATSASGTTPRVVQALERARQLGALTVAVTGAPDGPVAEAAEHRLVTTLDGPEPSPGIRTYQASLVALLTLAAELGGRRRPDLPEGPSDDGRDDTDDHEGLASLTGAVEATARALRSPCDEVAALVADAPVVAVVGSGPSHGTALFAAAKFIEAAGVPALGQDLEEWWHVERFAYPLDMPLFVVAPPGRAYGRAAELAGAAAGLGRRVVAVVRRGDTAVARHARAVLPVDGDVPEELSPLLYHLFAGLVASRLATALGRSPFLGPPDVPGPVRGDGTDRPASPPGGG